MTRPEIQIDDTTREMTEEEYANYLKIISDLPKIEAINDMAG